ncbi:M48 family metallopeptidase [Cardiobacteriaceae bacterium TAE3-ERU3]|nr:M48 family metallopeptidase [Cardiobacteriaceae bacterium TAE3-ERU3]
MNSQLTRIHHGQTLNIEYRRGNRRQKHMRLTIRQDGSILLSTPPRTSSAKANRFLDKHLGWLADKQQQRAAINARHPAPQYNHGAQHQLLGQTVTLHVKEAKKIAVVRHDDIIKIQLPNPTPERIEAAYQQYCRKTALDYFQQRLIELLPTTPWVKTIPELRVRRMKQQWGNCARKGHITLNQHLIKAPPECIDLVIIHELCHLKHFNHSPDFYQLMGEALPNWRQYDQILKAHIR